MSSEPTSPYPDFPFIPKKQSSRSSKPEQQPAASPPPVEPERPMLKRSSSASPSPKPLPPVTPPAERSSRSAAGEGANRASSSSSSERSNRGSSRSSAPPPASVQVSSKKKPVKDPDEFDDDLFSNIEPEAAVRSRPTLRRKKKVTNEVAKRKFEYQGEGFFAEFLKHPTEVAMPATSFFISLGIVIAIVSFNTNAIFGGIGEKAGAAITLGLTMALVAFNVVFSIIGLYIAAALFSFGYGALATAPLKMASIVTTRLAVELAFLSIGIPGIGMVSYGVELLFVYSMFITYFELDFHEVGPSLFVIGIVRFLAFIAVGAIAVALIMGGKISLDDLQNGGAETVIEGNAGEGDNLEMQEFEVDPVTGQLIPVQKDAAAAPGNEANGQPGGEQPAGQVDPGGNEEFDNE